MPLLPTTPGRGASGGPLQRARIIDTPASPAEPVRVVIPAFGAQFWGPIGWAARVDADGRIVMPVAGAAAVVALDERRQPLTVVSWGDGTETGTGPTVAEIAAGDIVGRMVWRVLDGEPPGWLRANGQPVTTDYPVLRGLLLVAGSPHGASSGDPLLPDMVERVPRGAGNVVPPLGATGGADTVALTISEMPAHQHSSVARVAAGAGSSVVLLGATGRAAPDVTTASPLAIGSQGAGAPHENLPPFANLTPLVRAY